MAFKLTIARGYEQGKEIIVAKDEATIGRTEDNDVVLTEIGVSRRHVRLFTRAGRACVEDLGSHRTLLNDSPLTEPGELGPEDLLALGPVVLKVALLPAREAPPPIDRGDTRVAPPDPGEAPDIHRLPTAPAGPHREVVPIDRGPTAPLPVAPAPPASPEPLGNREPTDPERPSGAPVLPPLPAGLISRLKKEPAPEDASGPATPAFDVPSALESERALGEVGPPPSPARGTGALGAERAPESAGRGHPARGPSDGGRPSGQKDALRVQGGRASGAREALGGARLGASGQRDALRSSGQKQALRPSAQRDALKADAASRLPPPPEALRASGQKEAAALGDRASPRSSGAREAQRGPAEPPRASGQKGPPAVAGLAARARNEAAGIFDDAIRPAAYPPEDDRPTMARPNTFPSRRPLRVRSAVIGAALVVSVLALISSVTWFVSVRSHGPQGPSELDREPLEASFGVGPGVTYRIDGEKVFELELPPEPRVVAVLHFDAEFLSEGELQVTLNGAPLSHTAGAGGEGVSEVEVVLLREALRPDGDNVLTVRRTPHHPADPNWRVARPWVERVGLPDEPDAALVEGALRFAARGREYLDRSAAAPDSLFQAWRAYRLAWLTVEPVRPPHPLFLEASMKYAAIGQSLDQRCLALISAAERSLQGRDAEGARDSLDQVARYFPSGEHRCHNLALELLAHHGL